MTGRVDATRMTRWQFEAAEFCSSRSSPTATPPAHAPKWCLRLPEAPLLQRRVWAQGLAGTGTVQPELLVQGS
jgi:hypothetical protein